MEAAGAGSSAGAGGRAVTLPATLARLRDGTPVAAWLFKANPAVWDLVGAMGAGEEVDSWRMAHSYRVALLDRGQPAVLWVTRDPRGGTAPGVWAVGEIAGMPVDDVGDPYDGRWRDRAARRQVRPYVPVRFEPVEPPLERSVLDADGRFASAEIRRCPRMGSPLALTPGEWQAVREHL